MCKIISQDNSTWLANTRLIWYNGVRVSEADKKDNPEISKKILLDIEVALQVFCVRRTDKDFHEEILTRSLIFHKYDVNIADIQELMVV